MDLGSQTEMDVVKNWKTLPCQNRKGTNVLRLGKKRFMLDEIFVLRYFKR